MTVLRRIKDNFQRQGVLTQIIIINVAIFLTVNIVGNISHVNLLSVLALPVGGVNFLWKFWTIFTYMFTHQNLGHIFWNMIIFYFMAQTFFIIMGQKKLLYLYVMSGVAGGALVLVLGMVFGRIYGDLIGASAAVMGVGAVMAVYSPNYRVYLFGMFEMAYKWFYLLLFGMSTIIDLSVNTGGKISHVGGALFGLLYGYYLKQGRDLFDLNIRPRRKSRLKVAHRAPASATTGDEQKMNELLDKISKSGYDSLSKSEKDELFRLSQKK